MTLEEIIAIFDGLATYREVWRGHTPSAVISFYSPRSPHSDSESH